MLKMKTVDDFCGKLNEMKCNYKSEGGENGKEVISIGLSGDNFSGLQFIVIFDNDTSAQIKCCICKFTEDKNLLMLQVVNQLNNQFRWTTFSALPSGIVNASLDVETTENSGSEIFLHSLYRIHTIVDKAYPVLMKAIYA